MNEKDKKLIEDIKSWKISDEKKKWAISFIRKDRRQREAFMKMSKEERLNVLYSQYIAFAFAHGYMFGYWSASKGGIKAATSLSPKEDLKQLKAGLTCSLKDAKVLPLRK